MKLVLFGSRSDSPRGARVGVLLDDTTVADVTQAAANAGHAALSSMRAFLDAGDEGGKWAAAAVADPTLHLMLDAERVLLAPIYDPEKVLCVGMNYVDHCTEQGVPIPVEPIIFNKFASAIRASGDPLIKSSETSELDFEVELTVVIGKTGKRISKEDALGYVAGYTVAHDVSARDLQLRKNGGQWLLGKAMDGFAPLGPAIVTPDEVGDVHNLRLRTVVNGEVMQDSSTSQLVHKVPDLIAYISRFMTLRPGDLILTGTPPGVGCFRKPPVWLKAGDVVTVEIEKLGAVTNTVVDEEA